MGRRDPWRVAVVATCLNRCRGARAEPVLRALFRRWPTAERLWRDTTGAALSADAYVLLNELRSLLRPLGFVSSRAGVVTEAARIAYVCSARGEPRSATVAALATVRGVGPSAVASMRYACLGDLRARTTDREVTRRIAHLRRERMLAAARNVLSRWRVGR